MSPSTVYQKMPAKPGNWEPAIREYMAYCHRIRLAGLRLKPKYHPTAEGAVKMIAHHDDKDQAKEIKKIFTEVAARNLEAAS